MRHHLIIGFAVSALSLLVISGFATPQNAVPKEAPISFRTEVEPILKASCIVCHNADKPTSGLLIDSVESLFKGGKKHGAQIIVRGKPEESLLIAYLRGKGVPQMPIQSTPLSEGQIQRIEAWIRQGAKAQLPPAGWPYARPTLSPVPVVKETAWVRNPVDNFVLAKLEANGIFPAPLASKTTLLRRLYMDLVGMPPTLQEAFSYMADSSPSAYEKLVDKLLADSRYGERWGRHWLDLVRYADTDGDEDDSVRPYAWRYRDYVVRAFNSDKPYDRFVREQLAGDELFPNDLDALIATGYLRLGQGEDDRFNDDGQRRYDFMTDVADTTSTVMLGLTFGCARCHDHKIDRRLHQTDYFRMQAFFAGTRLVNQDLGSAVPDPPEVKERYERVNAVLAPLRQQRRALRDRYLPTVLAEKQREKPNKRVEANENEINEAIDKTPEDKDLRERLDAEIRRLEPQVRGCDPVISVIREASEVPPTYFLNRGELYEPDHQRRMEPGFPAIFSNGASSAAKLVALGGKRLGRRAAFANWIVSAENPMTAKVIVNRVWRTPFGKGIVDTPSDFGSNGDLPSHPELLNWLAVQFTKPASSAPNDLGLGWSFKRLHRLLLTSNAYRQSTQFNAQSAAVDPENRLLWRMNRLRLEGEAVRDSVLGVSGKINLRMGGPGVFPALSKEDGERGDKWGESPEDDMRRRSLYVFQRRSFALPIIDVYDGPDMAQSCAVRVRTTTVPQVFALFNSEFGRSMALGFAGRVQRTAQENNLSPIETAYWLAFVRRPTAKQQERAERFLFNQSQRYASENLSIKQRDTKALTDFCHALINSNEFLYLD